jgi:hypothetical protein
MFFDKDEDTYHINLTTVFQSFSETEVNDLFEDFLTIYLPQSEAEFHIQDKTKMKEKFIFYFNDLNSGHTRMIADGEMLFLSLLGPFMNDKFAIGGNIHTKNKEIYKIATKKLGDWDD